MARRGRVLVTGSTLAPPAAAILAEAGLEVTMMPGPGTAAAIRRALEAAPTQAILMRGNPPLTADVMDAAPALRVIAKHGVGIDSVDLEAAKARGIAVLVAGEANAPAVAEHTLALILALARDVAVLAARTRAGFWDREGYSGHELAGRCLGLVGFGRVARMVAPGARALGLDVLALPHRPGTVDPALAREAADLPALLSEADMVSLHVPLTQQTTGMIGAAAIAAMKPGALLINTARGALLDEDAVAAALEDGRLGGAALDTLAAEPPPAGHRLLTTPRTIVTPHIASATGAALVRMGVAAARNIVMVLDEKTPGGGPPAG